MSNEGPSELVLDREAALGHVGNDAELLREMVEMFADYYPSQLQRITAAIDAQDPRELREAAHQLKGAVGNFFAKPSVSAAYELECAGRDGILVEADSLNRLLTGRLNELEDALKRLVEDLS